MMLDVVLEAQFQQPTSLPGGSEGKSSASRRQRIDGPDVWGITVDMYLTPSEESGEDVWGTSQGVHEEAV